METNRRNINKGRKDVTLTIMPDEGDQWCPNCKRWSMYQIDYEGQPAYECIYCGLIMYWKNDRGR